MNPGFPHLPRRRRPTRREFLRSMTGAALALPFLESLATAGIGSGVSQPATRVLFFYAPNGVMRRAFFPSSREPGLHELELTRTLAPLANLRSKVNLLSNLDRVFQPGTDVHAQCASCFLSSAAPFSIDSSAWPLDRSLDQLIADRTSENTPFRSLELSCNSHKDNRESMYFDNISWFGTGHAAPSLRDPHQVYRRLFGTGERKASRDITDLVLEDARELRQQLGAADADRLDEYFDALRAIERQLDKLEAGKNAMPATDLPQPEPGCAELLPRSEYLRLMADLMVLALRTNLTHVGTFMAAPERWGTPFLYDGVSDKPLNHHAMSHDPAVHGKTLEQVDLFYMRAFAYILEKLDAVEEADGRTLLDHSIVTYGSGLKNGHTHLYDRLPIVTAGSAGGRIRTGTHLVSPAGTPLANLWLTYARLMGVPGDRFADSTGELSSIRT